MPDREKGFCFCDATLLQKELTKKSDEKVLQALGQLELVTELMPMIVTIPSAAARCTAQAHVWGAVIDLDLATQQARRSGEKGPPANDLKGILMDSFIVETITAKESGIMQLDSHVYSENGCQI